MTMMWKIANAVVKNLVLQVSSITTYNKGGTKWKKHNNEKAGSIRGATVSRSFDIEFPDTDQDAEPTIGSTVINQSIFPTIIICYKNTTSQQISAMQDRDAIMHKLHQSPGTLPSGVDFYQVDSTQTSIDEDPDSGYFYLNIPVIARVNTTLT